MHDPHDQDAFDLQFGAVLSSAARVIGAHEDAELFLQWARAELPAAMPGLFAQATDDQVRGALAAALGRAIWNATPLPSNRLRPRPLPEPGRNDPCHCGSGAKYKRCCGQIPLPPLQIDPELMLAEVLGHWPASRLRELPYDQLSVEALGAIGAEWVRRGDAARAVNLLEPLFVDIDRLDARAELAFDALADAYLRLGRPKKKTALVARVARVRAPELRAAAMQRQCVMLFDAGRREEAWRLFERAQRECPDHPAFAHLEVLLLMSANEVERAVERAKFWIARLTRRDAEGHRELIAFLRGVVADPRNAVGDAVANEEPQLARFKEEVVYAGERPPAPRCTVTLTPDGLVFLEPDRAARKLIARWRRVFPDIAVDLTAVVGAGPDVWDEDDAPAWLEFLERHPAAFDVLEILDDLVLALHQLPDELHWFEATVAEPLLLRAQALLDQALTAHGAEQREVPWGGWANRPALRLLANLAYFYIARDDYRRALPVMERLVCTLNPNDNHGLREPLSRAYLVLDQSAKAIDLAARYPDDALPALAFNRVLALYRLGDVPAAQAALALARRASPRVVEYLLAERPAQPRLTPGRVTFGGRDEAWYYREDHLALWRAGGALDWLRAQTKRLSARKTVATE